MPSEMRVAQLIGAPALGAGQLLEVERPQALGDDDAEAEADPDQHRDRGDDGDRRLDGRRVGVGEQPPPTV